MRIPENERKRYRGSLTANKRKDVAERIKKSRLGFQQKKRSKTDLENCLLINFNLRKFAFANGKSPYLDFLLITKGTANCKHYRSVKNIALVSRVMEPEAKKSSNNKRSMSIKMLSLCLFPLTLKVN